MRGVEHSYQVDGTRLTGFLADGSRAGAAPGILVAHEARADWQLHIFGGVGHSFTNRDVDALGFPGFAYDAQADRRAWQMMLGLLEESFGARGKAVERVR